MKQSRIQCLDRAMDIIEAIAARGEAGVTELARALGLHVATVHNILVTLTARRYLLSEGGRYRIGPALGALGGRWDPIALLPRLAQPHLDDLTERTGEAAVVTLLAGETAVMVATTAGKHEVTAHYPRQVWPDPLVLATGRLLVAFEDEERRALFIRRHLEAPRTGSAAAVGPAEWDERLRRVREENVAYLDAGGMSYSVAVPVRAGDRVIAAFGVTCPAFRATEEHRKLLREAVTAAAEGLSRQL